MCKERIPQKPGDTSVTLVTIFPYFFCSRNIPVIFRKILFQMIVLFKKDFVLYFHFKDEVYISSGVN